MIGIQGSNGLEEVTKSPCDTSLDANSTNAVENRVVKAKFDEVNTSLSNKQDKLTNPLIQGDVINNLTSTSTNKPLSAAQGKALNTSKANISAVDTNKTYGQHTITFAWTNDSYLQIMVDNTVVCQLKGFKKYD